MKNYLTALLESFAAYVITKAMRTPYYHLKGYMDRYWLVPYKVGGSVSAGYDDGTGPVAFTQRPFAWVMQKLDIAARVHHILRSDDDRAPHDHPWAYLTIVLRGGYWENVPKWDKEGHYLGMDRKWHGPGSILFKPAKSWHILELPEGQTAWTIFITGRKVNDWGFLVNLFTKEKMGYKKFLGIPDTKDES